MFTIMFPYFPREKLHVHYLATAHVQCWRMLEGSDWKNLQGGVAADLGSYNIVQQDLHSTI